MAKLNSNKLQTQKNFQSIWHHDTQFLSSTLQEDQLIRNYIMGTLKSQDWNISEIIIKRQVKLIHIIFQIQKSESKEISIVTKNRLKNRIKRKNLKKSKSKNNIQLFFQIFLMVNQLRKMLPNNNITFYIQKVKPLQYNTNLINSWIISNINKKKSYKRLINRIINKYKKGIILSNFWSNNFIKTWKMLNIENRKIFINWFTANLIDIYNINYNYKYKNILKLYPYNIKWIPIKNKLPFLSINNELFINKLKNKEIKLKEKSKISNKIYAINTLNNKIKKLNYNINLNLKSIWKFKELNKLFTDKLLLFNYILKHLELNWQPEYNKNYLWQSKKFLLFLNTHPKLLDEIINNIILKRKKENLTTYLTKIWIKFFDYIYHLDNQLSKWKGIRIILSGRISAQKKGRAKKYIKSWGSTKNSSSRLPHQYTYSQINTRYGIMGIKLFMR